MSDLIALLWKARDFPTYWPPGFWKLWLIPLAALAVAPMLYFRFCDRTHRDAYLVRQEQAARLQGLDNEGFRFVENLATNVDRERVQIRAQEPEPQADGSIVHRVALVYPNSVSRFSYVVLAGHNVWHLGSANTFASGDPAGMPMSDGLRRDFVEALVKESDKLVCIGLASSEPAPGVENTRLSDDRAINLCRALHNIGYADASRQQAYGLSIGEAPATGAQANHSLQRSVIIVGVLNSRRLPRPRDIIQTLTQLAQIPGVRIDQYQRSVAPTQRLFVRVGPGVLDGRASGTWTNLPDDDGNPFD